MRILLILSWRHLPQVVVNTLVPPSLVPYRMYWITEPPIFLNVLLTGSHPTRTRQQPLQSILRQERQEREQGFVHGQVLRRRS